MDKPEVEIDLLFETSWEVCNKIGGIYAVLSTKARTLQTLYKDKVIFVGPDVWSSDNPSPYFIESHTLLKDWKADTGLPEGISVRVGRWNVPGKPITVLVKFDAMYAVKDALYARMWELYEVDSLHAYGDYDEACAFSHAAALVIESIARHRGYADGRNIIAHFNEWTTGMGLLHVKDVMPRIATVFTTHATSIGRSICGNNKPLYDYFSGYNGDQMAAELNMQSKHSLEKAAAHNADCFTTVSEVTARECEQLLGIRPHVVTPNGFEKDFVPSAAKLAKVRQAARAVMLNVASSLIGAKQPADSFIVATSGRCEFRNKGIDLFIASMKRLTAMNPKRNVIAFVLVPAWVREPRADLARKLGALRKSRLDEPYITHWLNNHDFDAVVGAIRASGITNDKTSPVKLIYVPCYLDGKDGIFNLTYYDLLAGMDATAFPSYYEPWGYTPLESIAFGVPTITTSLSGFGQWILGEFTNGVEACGVKVLPRTDSNFDEVADHISRDIFSLLQLPSEMLAEIARVSMATADRASWSNFMSFYVDAFAVAIGNCRARNNG